MKDFFSKHWLAWLFAIAVGAIFVAPQLFFITSLGSDFNGVYRELSGDELFYMARVQEVVDGHLTLNNPYYVEHKEGVSAQFFLPEVLASLPAKLFNVGIFELFVFYDFALPAIIYLIAYGLFLALGISRGGSSIGALVLVLLEQELLSRPINLQFVVIPFLLFLLTLLQLVKKEKSWPLVLVGGGLFGLLFHLYLYFWSFAAVLVGIMLINFFVQQQWGRVARLLHISAIAALIATPYFYRLVILRGQASFIAMAERLGLLYTRIPSGFKIILPAAILVICLIAVARHQKINFKTLPPTFIFLLSGLITSVVVVNQHLITGINILFSSHYQFQANVFFILTAGYLFWQVFSQKKVFLSRLVAVLLIGVIGLWFAPRFFSQLSFSQSQITDQRYGEVINWLNANTANDSVVLSFGRLNTLIPAYTHNNVYYQSLASLYALTDEQVQDRFVRYYAMHSARQEEVRQSLFGVRGIALRAAGGKQRQLNALYRLIGKPTVDLEAIYFPDKLVGQLYSQVNEYVDKSIEATIGQYQVDYIILDSTQEGRNGLKFDLLKQFKPIFSSNGISIFSVDLIKNI